MGRVALANRPHKDLQEKEKGGEGIVTRYYRGGRRPKHQGQAPHTGGDLPSYLTPLTQEIAEYVRATGPCVGSALNTPPAAGPERQALSAKPIVPDPLVTLSVQEPRAEFLEPRAEIRGPRTESLREPRAENRGPGSESLSDEQQIPYYL